MTPEPQPSSPPEQSTVLPFLSRVRQQYNMVREDLPALYDGLVEELRTAAHDDIVEVRQHAQDFGQFGWRVECACDAQFAERAHAPRGRGNRDITEIGVKAAIRRKAKAVGVTPRTIEKNAQIHRLAQQFALQENGVLGNAILTNKHFYIAALSAADPLAALDMFAGKKQTLPRFKVSDAYRLLEAQSLTKTQVTTNALAECRTPERNALLAHFRWVSGIILNQIIPNCPDEDFKNRVYANWLTDIRDELAEVFYEDVFRALRKAWLAGNRREDAMRAATGFPADVVGVVMYRLEDEGEFILVPEPGTPPDTPKLWHLAGQPLPAALRMRRA